jgi:hypothetical protein
MLVFLSNQFPMNYNREYHKKAEAIFQRQAGAMRTREAIICGINALQVLSAQDIPALGLYRLLRLLLAIQSHWAFLLA